MTAVLKYSRAQKISVESIILVCALLVLSTPISAQTPDSSRPGVGLPPASPPIGPLRRLPDGRIVPSEPPAAAPTQDAPAAPSSPDAPPAAVVAPRPTAPQAPAPAGRRSAGIVVTATGHVLTTAYVVDGCRRLRVTQANGTTQDALFIARETERDLGLARMQTPQSTVAALRDGPSALNTSVKLVGYPLLGGARTPLTVLATLSAREDTNLRSVLRLSASAQQNTNFGPTGFLLRGSPVADSGGGVVGVLSASNPPQDHFDAEGKLTRRDSYATDARTCLDFLRRNGVTPATQPTTADPTGYTVVVECAG
jgi:S1-C subfamily serine protease